MLNKPNQTKNLRICEQKGGQILVFVENLPFFRTEESRSLPIIVTSNLAENGVGGIGRGGCRGKRSKEQEPIRETDPVPGYFASETELVDR